MVIAGILTLIFGAAVIIGGWPLWVQGQRREAAVYIILSLTAYALSVLLALGVHLPYVTTAIWEILRHVVHLDS